MLVNLFNPYMVGVGLALLVAVVWSGLRCAHALHMLQLDSYANSRLLRWLWAAPSDRLIEWRSGLCLVGLFVAHVVFRVFWVEYGPYLVLGVWCIAGSMLVLRQKQPEAKKPLVYTARAIRILVLAVLIEGILAGALGLVVLGRLLQGVTPSETYWATSLVLIAGLVLIQLAPLAVVLANVLLVPVQSAINRTYLASARKRLQAIKPVVVGITGSYGKTSTKYFLHTILSDRFTTLMTPQSFNTLMGICRVVNGDLQPQHEIFVVEMGAYRKGDIQELADFVQPQIGMLTAIGPQHLERFKTIENIAAAKYELITSLPPSGVAVFNNDDQCCRKLADRTTGVKVLRYGLDGSQPGLRVWAEAVVQQAEGQSFTLVDSDGNRATTRTVLLGRHNVLNMLGAVCIALELGMSLQDVARAIPQVQPAPHRLQLLQGAGGVTVIDDSYNSNPIGAAEALKALQAFETGKRVLVTPGMVELGTVEAEQNEAFGASAAKVCDYVLLVGPRQTQAILKGLKREQFPPERIRIVNDLAEATSELQHIVQAGDIVLFENDLPDLYTES